MGQNVVLRMFAAGRRKPLSEHLDLRPTAACRLPLDTADPSSEAVHILLAECCRSAGYLRVQPFHRLRRRQFRLYFGMDV